MKNDEKIVKSYLDSIDYHDIKYEPLGKSRPPDFSLDGIGIEVRRLNYDDVENREYKMLKFFNSIIDNIVTDGDYNNTLIISYSYKNIIPKKLNKLKISINNEIKNILKNISNYNTGFIGSIKYNDIEIRFYKSEIKLNKPIILGTMVDCDTGGFIISNIYSRLKEVIPEKEEKIKDIKQKFDKWWLVLVDYIGIGSDIEDHDFQQLNNLEKITKEFDKIIIVTRSFSQNDKVFIHNDTKYVWYDVKI